MSEPLRIFVIAGEASGDHLGASLARALRDLRPDVELRGIGGEELAAVGMRSIFPMHELSVMGVFEVLPRLPRILSRMRQAVREIMLFRPHAVITIDSPDFCFRVVKKVKARDRSVPCIHYVAPSVWAWRPGRAKKIARFLDHLLCLLPFEPPYFEKHGLAATFVGHPVVERMSGRGDGARFRERHGIRPQQPVLCMLPGSRMSELARLLPKFRETADIVLRAAPSTVIAVPTLPHLKRHIEDYFVGEGINPIVTARTDEKFDCFAASRAAIAASGTVTLELAVCDTPHIIAYKLGPVSAWIAKRIIKTPFVNLINIILGRAAVPELLLENCEPGPMSRALLRLVNDTQARTAQLTSFREALIRIGMGDPRPPGEKAARAVLRAIGAEPSPANDALPEEGGESLSPRQS